MFSHFHDYFLFMVVIRAGQWHIQLSFSWSGPHPLELSHGNSGSRGASAYIVNGSDMCHFGAENF